MAILSLNVGANTVIELRNLTNVVSGAYDNAATVAVTIKTMAGIDVTGATWPVAMPYVSASNGKYRATLASNLGITKGQKYRAYITIAGTGAITDYREVDCIAVVHGSG